MTDTPWHKRLIGGFKRTSDKLGENLTGLFTKSALDEAARKGGKASAKTASAKDGVKVAEDVTAPNDDTPAAQALAALTSPERGVSVAATALKMLQNAAEARDEARDKAEKDRKAAETEAAPRAVLDPYVIGDKIDRSV